MEANKKVSKKETTASSEATSAAKKLPSKIIRFEDVSVSIFTHERETGGIPRVRYSCSFSRSYEDSAGVWKRTQWFGESDLAKVISCAQKASEYITSLTSPSAER